MTAGAATEAKDGDVAQRRPQVVSIQYLRGIAALGVVLYHASLHAGSPIATGAFGVNLFFVISGFLMVAITDETSRPWPFLKDRFLRIVPLYWLATFAQLAFWFVSGVGLADPGWWAASLLFFPMRYPAAPEHVVPVIYQGWTLNYEVMFYLAFGLVLFLPRRLQLPVLSAAFIALVIVGYASAGLPTAIDFWTRPIIIEFLVGAWLGWLWTRRDGSGILGWILIAGGAVQILLPQPPVLGYALILAGALMLDQRGLVASWPVPKLIGDASYSIYLWHYFGIWIAAAAIGGLALPTFLLIPLQFAAGLAAGLLAYVAVEAPILAFFRRQKYRRGFPVPAGV